MMVKVCKLIPGQMSPGQTRFVLPVKTRDGSVKCAMAGIDTLRIGSANVGTIWGRDGEVVDCGNGWKKTSGFLLSSIDRLKRHRCKKFGWTKKVMCSG